MTEAAKRQKAQEILNCTAGLFLHSDYEAITMSAVAREMHISNGILFVYFPTKQTLFFSLLMREYHARIEAMQRRVQANNPASYEALCELIIADLEEQLKNTLYVRLESIRSAILEKNIDLELVFTLKTELYRRMAALAEVVAIPGVVTAREILDIFHVETALIGGFQQASDLPAAMRQRFMQNGLNALVHDAKSDTLHTMRLYLRALRQA